MNEGRWEHGSDYHWSEPSGSATYPWDTRASLFGCGRYAMQALLHANAVRRLWIPSYFCQEVAAALAVTTELRVYRDRPTTFATSLADCAFAPHDAVLVVNTLGLRAAPPEIPDGVLVIEDHTHDVASEWARRSTADYCVASLRKVLPVPDGGVVWSPRGGNLPVEPEVHAMHREAALARVSAMLLKASYLAGANVDKAAFRALAVAGEAAIAGGPPAGISELTRGVLPAFPLDVWRAARVANFRMMRSALEAVPGLRVLEPAGSAVSYAVSLVFERALDRDRVRAALIAARIYPAILWSMEHQAAPVTEDDIDLSRRILSVHCDHRYSAVDCARVVTAISKAAAA